MAELLSKKIQSPEKMAMSVALASIAQRSHHRRDLEDDEELSSRDIDAEELFASMREHAGKHIRPILIRPMLAANWRSALRASLPASEMWLLFFFFSFRQGNKEGRSSRLKSRQAKTSGRCTGPRNSIRTNSAHHHRRDLEYIEELSRRHLDAEELLGRRNDDLLAECDFFDDLD